MLMKERDANLRRMEAAVDAFRWEDRGCYADYLAQTYHYASHSVPLLGAMMAQTTAGSAMFAYCARAVQEEMHHEQLARNDLRQLGSDIDDYPELPTCRLLWEPQFYKAEHVSPEAVAGYIFMLESLAVTRGKSMGKRAAGHRSITFLQVHTEKDEAHSQAIAERISAFGEDHLAQVLENMQQTATAYIAMMQEITARQ